MMRGGGERLGGMMLGRLRALNLTAEQWTRVREIHQNTQKQVIPKQAEVRVAEIELCQLMQAATPNMSQIDAKIAEISTKRADVQKLHVRALIQVRGVLTPEQLQKFLDPTWRPALGKGAAGNEEGPMLRRRMMRQMQDDD